MARKAAPSGAREVKELYFKVADTFGNSKRGLARALNISYYQANKIIEAKKSRAPITQWIGEKGDPRAEARVRKMTIEAERSGWELREQSIKGKKVKSAIPPEPIGDISATPIKRGKFKNGERVSYKYEPNKKIKVPKGSYVQIVAKGKGKSKGKKINKLPSSASGSVKGAWALWNRARQQTGFVPTNIEIVVTEFK